MSSRPVTNLAPLVLLLSLAIAACGGEEQSGTQDSADSAQFEVSLPDSTQPVDLFDPNDTSSDAPDTAPCVGCTGYPCATNAECNSGFCIEAANGRECADFCRDECPIGYGCRGVQGPGGDPVYLCIYQHVTYCQPCKADRDCETGLGGLLGARCVQADPEDPAEGRFCRTPCDTSAACPSGASCEAVSVGGTSEKLCRPGTAAAPGPCACSRRAVALGAATVCEIGNALGTCSGERRCEREGVAGLSMCDARTPVSELCNAIDDNCNGTTDEGFSELGQTCDGDDSDRCKDGVWVCGATGVLACTDDLASQIERCNGLDDDCDGETDEDFIGLGEPCDGVDADLCKDGVWVCDGLSMVCNDDATSKSETCNGLDDDCDGVIDDGYDVGTPCDGPEDPDTCPDGVKVCNAAGNGTVCEDGPAGPVELCNGVDDDCDGAVDEGFEGKGTPCDGDDFDGCADGVLVCSPDGTRLICNDDASSRVELCNELDDDCRGGPDDTFPLKLTPCDGPDADQCPDGVWVCSADGLGLDCTDDGVSRIEVCNDQDDDCDGSTDEDFPLKGQPCDSPIDTDLCATGVWVCGNNTLVCTDDAASTTELCNGLDDDCDGQTDEVVDLVAPLNPNQNGLCAGTRQRCGGLFGWASDYGGVAQFGQNETPDASFLDENCDGLDGTETIAVFVRQGAANSGTCTKASPCGSLTYAITQTTATRRHVYVQAGTYDNIVEVPSGKDIEVYGGYDTTWRRRPRTEAGHTVTLRGARHTTDDEYLTVRVRSATVKFADLVIVGPSPSPSERKDGRGYSTYAVHAVASTVTLERVDIQQGNAASGANGATGTNALSLTAPEKALKGGNATQAVDTCDNSSRGLGAGGRTNAQCGTGTSGAGGGNGGTMDTSCGCAFGVCVCTTCAATAGSGGGTGSGAAGGGGGGAGSGGSSCSGVGNGNPGGTPTQGAGGVAGTRGGFLVGNYWLGGNGADGTTGSHGSGGGGGGGSGGCDRDGGIPLQNSSGAGGGGGGAGGCAAQTGGAHGKAGGSSFGVFASGGTVTARDCRFFLGNGGAGGTGGAGGQGQPGGLGGDGGNAAGTSQAGGSGGKGGDGAGSGGGGGGAGGSSYGVFSLSATVTTPNSTFTGGAAGAGGQGGTAQAATGTNGPGKLGQDGRVQNTRACNAANACGD